MNLLACFLNIMLLHHARNIVSCKNKFAMALMFDKAARDPAIQQCPPAFHAIKI